MFSSYTVDASKSEEISWKKDRSQSYSDYMANICESVQWCNMLCLVPHEKQNQIKGQILFFISQICQMSGFICIL